MTPPRCTINGVEFRKEKFRSQESLEGFPKLRQFFLAIVAFFIVSHIALNITAPTSFQSYPDAFQTTISYIFPCVGVALYILAHSRLLPKPEKSVKSRKLRSLLNFIAAIILTSYLVLFYPAGSNLELIKKDTKDWISTHTILSEPFYILFIFFAVCPTFLIKATVAAMYYITICALYIDINHPAFWWMIMRNACSCLLIIALLGLKSGFRWKSFLKTTELEEWNKVYQDILDRNPSAIAVIDSSSKVVYSNQNFKEMAQHDPQAFFQSVTNIRTRDFLAGSSNNFSAGLTLNSNMLSPRPLSQINSEESLVKRQNSLHSQKRNLIRMSTKLRMNTVRSCANLWELLSQYRSHLEKQVLDRDAQLIFDGKTSGRLDLTEQPRSKDMGKELGTTEREIRRASLSQHANTYEIIIRPCMEYKKLIVILNNTTERDLIVGLENSSDYKDKILASVSHELRTPLNGNLGCLQAALNDKSVPDTVKSNFLIPALRSGKLLLHVIDDIMDYSQLQSKGIKLKIEIKSLADTLNYCYELVEQSFRSKNLKLRIKLSEDLPKLFQTDHTRLKQILLNLLTNALKFTQQGGVTIRACCLKGGRVEIKVEDTGMGIKPESIHKLFGEKLLNQALGFKEVESKGVGLGLKISQKLAGLLSDDPESESPIQVRSVYGQGSNFMFVIKELSEMESLEESSVSIEKGDDQDHDRNEEHRVSIESLIDSAASQDVPLEQINVHEKTLHSPTKDYFRVKQPQRRDTVRKSVLGRMRAISLDKKLLSQKVLIVDDDPLNILVLESFVSQCGLPREAAHNGQEAVDKIIKNPEAFKLIFMDCQMPIMDGFEATRVLCKKMEDKEIPVIPIIGCTAFTSKDKLKQCIKSGMKEVLPKPVMKDQIADVLKRYLGISGK